jgi:ferric-dicitrate binding protein FerR (iron transport regulator)
MSTGFFEDLERQLVAATRERPRRLRRARARRAGALAGGLAVLVAACLALASTLQRDTGQERSAPAAPRPATTTVEVDPRTGAVAPSGRTTVAVLNGTTIPGLARGVANTLIEAHVITGTVTNAPDQTTTRTRVFYARGQVPLATQVAALLRLRGEFALRPIPTSLAAIAGTQAGVVVVAGTDRSVSPHR